MPLKRQREADPESANMPDHLSWTSHLFRAFYQEGVRHIYISPGSRSTPLVLGAATHPGFTNKVVLDERSAAFQALGSSKASGLPSVLICTSGTALANYHPAVIEARYSGNPLIIISADRPPHLRGTGSSQTIDQVKLFADSVLFFHELGEPIHEKRDYNRLSLLAKQAVGIATRQRGPVHLNAPFRKPLEPSETSLEETIQLYRNQFEGDQTFTHGTVTSGGSQELPEIVINLLLNSKKPILIAGPDEHSASLSGLVSKLSNELNIPVIAEPGSHLSDAISFIDRYDMILNGKNNLEAPEPDLIIKTGNQPFSKSLQEFEIKHRSIPVIQFLTRDTWQDSFGSTNHRILLGSNTPDIQSESPKNHEWFDIWNNLNKEAGKFLHQALQNDVNLTDGHVYSHLTRSVSNEWDIMVSNSFTIRDLALFGNGPHHITRPYVNRGAAGIDGILSTAIGIQHFNQKKMLVFIGDLAMLHDSNALLNIQETGAPLAIVVVNNGGGTIFRMLPIYRYKKYYCDFFETPQKAELSSLAGMHGISYLKIDSLTDLHNLNPDESVSDGPVLIECRTNPDKSMEMRNMLLNR
jgi:2-succinyl-5-enolpyruvyl-6-hydroxy-3-cyclohexene-1-carboxylate synthase